MGGPPVEPKPSRQRSDRVRLSGPSYGPGPSISSHQASPRFSRKKARRAMARFCPCGVISGRRPFSGTVMMEVRYSPLIRMAVSPLSTQNVL